MRRLLLPLPFLLAASCASTGFKWNDSVPGLHQDPWADASPDSWARYQTVRRLRTDDGATKELVSEWSMERTAEGLVETNEGGKKHLIPHGRYSYVASPGGYLTYLRKSTPAGREAVVVGGRTYDCEVTEYEFPWSNLCGGFGRYAPPTLITLLRIWTSEEARVPDNVLRWTTRLVQVPEGTSGHACEFVYTRINESDSWRGRTIRVSEVSYVSQRGGLFDWDPSERFERTTLAWSDEVPGRQLEYVREVKDGEGAEVERWTDETLDYGLVKQE